MIARIRRAWQAWLTLPEIAEIERQTAVRLRIIDLTVSSMLSQYREDISNG